MTQTDILSVLPPLLVRPFFYGLTYARPTTDWLLYKFAPWFRDVRWAANKNRWAPKNDCDKFARRWVIECQDAHSDSTNDNTDLAVGEFCYISANGPHAIVIAIVDTPPTVLFIEPQTGSRLALTPNEILTCFRVSF